MYSETLPLTLIHSFDSCTRAYRCQAHAHTVDAMDEGIRGNVAQTTVVNVNVFSFSFSMLGLLSNAVQI